MKYLVPHAKWSPRTISFCNISSLLCCFGENPAKNINYGGGDNRTLTTEKSTKITPDPETKQKATTPMETEMYDEESGIALVEKADLYITKGKQKH